MLYTCYKGFEMNEELLQQIKTIKETLKKSGFVIDGIFRLWIHDENRDDGDVDIAIE